MLLLSDEIPLGPVLVNKALDKELRNRIGASLLSLHRNNPSALEAVKAAWSEAKQATHFEPIRPDHYEPFLRKFGSGKETEAIIRQYIQ